MKARVLIVDDDYDHAHQLKTILVGSGHTVLVAETGQGGLAAARTGTVDLVILDHMLPDIKGVDVLAALKAEPTTRSIPVILVTASADIEFGGALDAGAAHFLRKPFTTKSVQASVRSALMARRLFTPAPGELTLTLHCTSRQTPTLIVSGEQSSTVTSSNLLQLDPITLGAEADSILRDPEWRRRAKTAGYELYKSVFVGHPDVLANLMRYTQPENEARARLRFMAPRDHLRIPFEFLTDAGPGGAGEYMVLRHPLSRFVSGVVAKRAPLSRAFLNERISSNRPLKILLVGSNTPPPIPGVDKEVEMLDELLQRLLTDRGIPFEKPTVLTGDAASLESVGKEISKGSWHILHYAGHGNSDSRSPEKSSLQFKDGAGGVQPMTASALALRLGNTDVRFVFLSACYGARSGTQYDLLNDDFLGMSDALICSGVPAVLGYRRPVSDEAAVEFAREFYTSLIRQGELDRAALDARLAAASDRDNPAWLTPVLTVQG